MSAINFRPTLIALFVSLGSVASAQTLYSVTGHYYQLVSTTGQVSWTSANTLANAQSFAGVGGHLVTITSQGEENFVNSLGDVVFMWTDGVQPTGSNEPAGGWTWNNGELMTYTDWAAGEPNEGGVNENRILFHNSGTAGNRKWMDIPDNGGFASIKGYVVEFDAVPEPSSFAALGGLSLMAFGKRRSLKRLLCKLSGQTP